MLVTHPPVMYLPSQGQRAVFSRFLPAKSAASLIPPVMADSNRPDHNIIDFFQWLESIIGACRCGSSALRREQMQHRHGFWRIFVLDD